MARHGQSSSSAAGPILSVSIHAIQTGSRDLPNEVSANRLGARGRADQAKSDVAGERDGSDGVAVGGAHVHWAIHPRTTAQHTKFGSLTRLAASSQSVGIRLELAGRPFPDVAGEVECAVG